LNFLYFYTIFAFISYLIDIITLFFLENLKIMLDKPNDRIYIGINKIKQEEKSWKN